MIPPATRTTGGQDLHDAGDGPRTIRFARAAWRAVAAAELGVSLGCTAGVAKLGLPPAQRRRARAGELAAARLDRLGGAYLKIGQVLATRADLLDDAQRAPLARLCDHATPSRARAGLVALACDGQGLTAVEPEPFAAGSFTHVHLARRLDTGERVVVKVLRPDARARFTADLALIRGFTRIGARMPFLKSVPAIDSVGLLADAVAAHLDLGAEAVRHGQLASDLACLEELVVPRLHLDLCTPDVLVMDHVAGAIRIDDRRLDPDLRRGAALTALRALYTMLFAGGLVHCDMHPGNLLVTSEGQLVLIDFGYAARLDPDQQAAFAELFKAMAQSDAGGVAEVVVQTATHLPARLSRDALASDLDLLVSRASGTTAEEFNVAGFVTSLFAVQRRHGIVASPGFTMGIVALATLEGLLKEFTPDVDFQLEAMPFVLRRLEVTRLGDRARAQARRVADPAPQDDPGTTSGTTSTTREPDGAPLSRASR
jgi:ubiquinone biosynthesis protein